MIHQFYCDIDFDLGIIHYEVQKSLMLNKSIMWCRWDQDQTELKVCFEEELTEPDMIIFNELIKNIMLDPLINTPNNL